MTGVSPATTITASDAPDDRSESPVDRERRGRRWLIWSFLLCPCHLPVTLGVLGAILGTSAFGGLVARNHLAIGILLTSIYAVGLFIGLRHIRAADKDADCANGSCDLP